MIEQTNSFHKLEMISRPCFLSPNILEQGLVTANKILITFTCFCRGPFIWSNPYKQTISTSRPQFPKRCPNSYYYIRYTELRCIVMRKMSTQWASLWPWAHPKPSKGHWASLHPSTSPQSRTLELTQSRTCI